MPFPHRAPLLAALLLLAAAPLAAQRREFTIMGGGNLTSATGDALESVDPRPGFTGGISFRLPRSSRITFVSQFLVTHRRLRGERPASSPSQPFPGPIADEAALTYLEIPLLLRFQRSYHSERPVRPFLELGPSVAIRLGCAREILEEGTGAREIDCSVTPDGQQPGPGPFIPALYQSMDIAVNGGVGVEIRGVSLGVRGFRSLRSLVETTALPSTPFDGARAWGLTGGVDVMVRVF